MPNQKRVLIAEDEKPLAHALELKLTKEGFEAVAVDNGKKCLELLKEQTFDVLLLDIMMPEMDGFQVLDNIKDLENKPAIFILSNLSQHEDEERARNYNIRHFFIKSNTPLASIVEEVKKV